MKRNLLNERGDHDLKENYGSHNATSKCHVLWLLAAPKKLPDRKRKKKLFSVTILTESQFTGLIIRCSLHKC